QHPTAAQEPAPLDDLEAVDLSQLQFEEALAEPAETPAPADAHEELPELPADESPAPPVIKLASPSLPADPAVEAKIPEKKGRWWPFGRKKKAVEPIAEAPAPQPQPPAEVLDEPSEPQPAHAIEEVVEPTLPAPDSALGDMAGLSDSSAGAGAAPPQ